jgi:hypothetical protein
MMTFIFFFNTKLCRKSRGLPREWFEERLYAAKLKWQEALNELDYNNWADNYALYEKLEEIHDELEELTLDGADTDIIHARVDQLEPPEKDFCSIYNRIAYFMVEFDELLADKQNPETVIE